MSTLTAPLTRLTGMRGFLIFWLGQLVSLLGTNMSRFALTIWAWELTGQATALALVAVFSFAPTVIVSPIAGAMVDRLPRKLMMMLSDAAAGVTSLVILLLYSTGNLQIWHLYVAGAFTGAFESFQFPAFSAAISTMVPKEQYGRANGLLSLAESVANIGAPVLAGLLLIVLMALAVSLASSATPKIIWHVYQPLVSVHFHDNVNHLAAGNTGQFTQVFFDDHIMCAVAVGHDGVAERIAIDAAFDLDHALHAKSRFDVKGNRDTGHVILGILLQLHLKFLAAHG